MASSIITSLGATKFRLLFVIFDDKSRSLIVGWRSSRKSIICRASDAVSMLNLELCSRRKGSPWGPLMAAQCDATLEPTTVTSIITKPNYKARRLAQSSPWAARTKGILFISNMWHMVKRDTFGGNGIAPYNM